MGAKTGGDFTENDVQLMLGRSTVGKLLRRWVSVGDRTIGVRMNWVTSLLAAIILFTFTIICYTDKNAATEFGNGKRWVAQNFTWAYILTQDVWCLFLIYLIFSKYGKIKLGKDDEKPRYSDFTWFSMLFTCGVAVGLYVFGVAEPLYFYRQPALWHSWAYDYAITKTGVENDAMRANQAIFMAVYHWGIHGWVPYILLALAAGLTSFRWGMPMTIRSCFYPILGDHSLGLVGDLIDALSISTTTFGVCTSLGLGVEQLSSGLGFLARFNCEASEQCAKAGGTWNINTFGASSCFDNQGAEVAYESCMQKSSSWLLDSDSRSGSYYAIIWCITGIATVSVLSGVDRGIKTLAMAAFSCGMVVLLTVTFADNTWYLLNVMVQSTGYYLQYVIQVGFDCEAFQQLNFEFQGDGPGNMYWGSQGSASVKGKLSAVGITIPSSSPDCGDQINLCTQGAISLAIAATASSADTGRMLTALGMSATSIANLATKHTQLSDAGFVQASVPCGSGWGTEFYDEWTVATVGAPAVAAAEICSGLAGAALTACNHAFKPSAADLALGTGHFPRCPEALISQEKEWGTCESYLISCPTAATYFGDTNSMFMDWWTIFYWAWWITWAPFVGFFVALISRGRTVREVIIGGFICPTLFAIMWFSVFGGLAIKMERTAEMALGKRPDLGHASVDCSEHYTSGGVPITPDSKQLATAGYYMLSCMPKNDQIYHIMEPYSNLTNFLQVFLWVGLVIYFLTSSDSGSMTDDIISASGLSANFIPPWQKVFWCCTEAAVASALIKQGGALKSLQALSIIIGLPFTILLVMIVPSIWRILKKEAGDEDIKGAKRFNTQLLDFVEGYAPHGGSPCTRQEHLKAFAIGLFAPGLAIHESFSKTHPDDKVSAIAYGVVAQCLLLSWFILHLCDIGTDNMHVLAWLCYMFFSAILVSMRVEMRGKYNVWGSPGDDIVAAIFFWPFACAQCYLMATTDGKDAPDYFESADQMIGDFKAQELEYRENDGNKPVSVTAVAATVVSGTASA